MFQFKSVVGQIVKFNCLLCSPTNKECSASLSSLSNLRKHVQVSRLCLLINNSCIHSKGISMVVLYFKTKDVRRFLEIRFQKKSPVNLSEKSEIFFKTISFYKSHLETSFCCINYEIVLKAYDYYYKIFTLIDIMT